MPERISRKFLVVLFLFIIFPVFASAQAALVNINTGGVTDLKTLSGIGDVKAQAIIDYRNSHGQFQKIEDIKNVSGIGDATYNNIKSFITVGTLTTPIQESSTNTASSTAATTTEVIVIPSTPVSSANSSSVHYSSSPVGINKTQTKITLSVGRDRIGSVGSPLEFRVETDMNYTRSSIFKWNFGDGSEGAGVVLSHTYNYPGDYVVVLNVSTPGGQAVARLNVKIVDPGLAIISASPERIEVRNNAQVEVSLFGRALVSFEKVFVFPQDTIIRAGQSIYFDSHVTGLTPTNIDEVNLLTIGEKRMESEVMAKVKEEKIHQVALIKNKIATLETQLANVSLRNMVSKDLVVVKATSSETALALEAVSNLDPKPSTGWFQTIRHFFLRKP